MSEIANLNKQRKAKARAEKERRAAANRIKFGRTRAERAADKKESADVVRHVDGSKIEDAVDAEDDRD